MKKETLHAMEMGIAVYLAILFTYILASNHINIYFVEFDSFSIFSAGISAAIAIQLDKKQTILRGLDRIYGTILGMLIGYPITKLLLIIGGLYFPKMILIPLLAGIGTFIVHKLSYQMIGRPVTVGTIALLGLLIQNPIGTTESYLFGRLIATIIGVLSALIVAHTFVLIKKRS